MTGLEVTEIFLTALALSTVVIVGVVVALFAMRAARKTLKALRRQRRKAEWRREYAHTTQPA